MPAEQQELAIVVKARDLASTPLGKFAGKLDAMAKKGGLVGSVLQGVGQGFGQMLNPIGLVTRGVGNVTDFLGDATRAAMEEDAAIAQLTTSIEENDEAWDGNIDRIEEIISSRRDLAFADDEQRDSLRQLVAVTKDSNEALRIQRIAMDLARLKGMSLADASTLLGKVWAGNTGILSRYGIQLEKGATSAEALLEIQARAAGQAETFAATDLGKQQVAQLKLNDAIEDFGHVLTPLVADLLPVVTDAIEVLADLLAEGTPAAKGFDQRAKEFFATGVGLEEIAQGTEEVSDGLGMLEDLITDTPLGILEPAMAERLNLWKEHHAVFERIGKSYHDWAPTFARLKNEAGLTSEAALALTLTWAEQETQILDLQKAEAAATAQRTRRAEMDAAAASQTEDANDDLSASIERVRAANMAALDASRKLADQQAEEAVAAAEKLEEAIDAVAGMLRGDLIDASKDALKSIRKMFDETRRPLKVLQREEEQLLRLRMRANRVGRFDIVAAIDARLDEIHTIEEQRRTSAASYRDERDASRKHRSDLEAIGRKYDVTREKAEKLLEAAGGDAKLVLSVDDSEVTAARVRLLRLLDDARGSSMLTLGPSMGLPPSGGSASGSGGGGHAASLSRDARAGGVAVNVHITPKVHVSGRDVTNTTTRLKLRSGS